MSVGWRAWWQRRTCVHKWRYHDPRDGKRFTGYLERCEKCGAIQQVPQ